MMKRVLILLLVVSIVLTTAGCGLRKTVRRDFHSTTTEWEVY